MYEKEMLIERKDIEYPDGKQSDSDYIRYCTDNKVSYATVNGGLVDSGSFRITSYDPEKGSYNGTFTLHFSEGILTGKFYF